MLRGWPMLGSSCCGARSRSGNPCRSPAMTNGSRRMHGRQSSGAPKGKANAPKLGLHTADAIVERREIAALLREMRELTET